MEILLGYECMFFEDCPEELVLSAVTMDKEEIDYEKIRPDDIICVRRK